jgi:ketosteroid isomerase-like protein
MSEENVEVVRSMYRAGDPIRFFNLLDEEVEIDASASPPFPDHPERVRGRDAVIDFYRHYWGTWDDYVLEPTEIKDAGENRVVVGHHERGRGRGSGAPFERRCAVAYTLRRSQVVRVQVFENLAEQPSKPPGFRSRRCRRRPWR